MHSCDQCGTTFTRKNNLTRHKNGRCKPVSTAKSSAITEETMTHDGLASHHHIHSFNVDDSKRLAVKRPFDESFLEPRPKNPKIQALLDEIVNDEPKRHSPSANNS